ncbi:putative surface protease GP63, partial [Trypanosoma cruzi]
MELEDEGGEGTKLSHWKKRNVVNEMMSSDGEIGYYSALTLAAFEDMGVYWPKYSIAETLWWGNNSGCEPLEKKCLIEGTTDHPDLFCNQFPDEDHMLYTHDRLSLGSRNVKMYDELLPVEHRHFVNTNLGGAFDFMDRCPIVEAYANTGCKNGMSSVMPGSFIGPNSRCVKGKHLQFDDK